MATAEGGAKANSSPTIIATASASSYGGGGAGAGGKFRKKPSRRQTTPYDRPLIALRGNDGNSTSWLTKLVVDPASKLISYGANRFFASVFRKRLPPPTPPQPPEVGLDLSEGLQTAVPDDENDAQEKARGDCSQQGNIFPSSGMTELEQLLKQKTFTISEIDHLTALLHSRTVEAPVVHESRRNEEIVPHSGKYQDLASVPVEEHRYEKTPVINRKVLVDDIASPAELAKAYMGSRPSKVSSSMVGMRSQVGSKENLIFASKSPILPLASRTSVGMGALENGPVTPKYRGGSGIFKTARTPYSRIRPNSPLKGIGNGSNGYAALPMLSSRSLVEHDEDFEFKPMTLKRRSSVLDDEIGSVSPVRRIKQKPNLLAPRIPHTSHGVGSQPATIQKLSLIDGPKLKAVNVGENVNESVPSTSYARIPCRSSEVAARILQHLEMLTPPEKSSVPKSVSVQEKSPFKLTRSMLRGQALRSMEDMDSSKLLPDVQDDHKLEDKSNATFATAVDSTSQKQGRVEENGPKESGGRSGIHGPVSHNDANSSVEPSGRSFLMVDSVGTNSVAPPHQKRRAFRMSAQEDSMGQDDDIHCNGLVPRIFSEDRGSTEAVFVAQKLQSVEEPNFVETTIGQEVKSAVGPLLSKPDGLVSPDAVVFGAGRGGISFSTSEKVNAGPKTIIPPLSSIAALDRPEESENPPAFGIKSTVADKFPLSPLESSNKKLELAPESSSRLVSVSSPTDSLMKIPEPTSRLNDGHGISISVPSTASNGSMATSSASISFATASYKDTTKISTSSATHSASCSISNATPSSTSTSLLSASICSTLVSPLASSTTAGPVFKFGLDSDKSHAVSAVSTAKISELENLTTKDEFGSSSGTSADANSSLATSASTSAGNSNMALGSSSDVNNLQQNPLFAATKPSMFSAGAESQVASNQADSVASFTSFSMNSSTAFGSSSSNSQLFNPSKPLGFSMLASSSAASAVLSDSSWPTTRAASDAASSTSAPVSSSSNASPRAFSFGLSSSSTPANAVGSSSSAAVFSFTSSSLASPPVANSAGSFSSSTDGIFGFSASSTSTTASNTFGSSGASNDFSSSWGASKSSAFGSLTNFPSPSSGFSPNASSVSAPSNASSMGFNPSTGASSGPSFSFTAAANAVSSSPSSSFSLPMFGNPSTFPASSGISDQANAEDSMAEDTVPSSAPSFPVFGQSSASSSGFIFGSTSSQSSIPFSFGGQQTQVALPNPSPFQSAQVAPSNPSAFQSSGSYEFAAPGGGFSLGSGDKSGRRFVKVNRNKNRKR